MIITVAHTKGGVGKSTIAWHLAHSIKDKKVTIVDLDFQQTLYFVKSISGSQLDVIQPQDADELLNILRENTSDIYIIDVGGFDSDINRLAIEKCDAVLIPVSDSLTEVLGFKTFESILDELNISARIFLVLNNVHPLVRNFDTIKEAVKNENITLLDTVLRSRKVYKTSMNIVEGDNTLSGVALQEIESLRDELI